jgi:hypothetical protein
VKNRFLNDRYEKKVVENHILGARKHKEEMGNGFLDT